MSDVEREPWESDGDLPWETKEHFPWETDGDLPWGSEETWEDETVSETTWDSFIEDPWRGEQHLADWPEDLAGPEYWLYKGIDGSDGLKD